MTQVCLFWDAEPAADGSVRITHVHHQPDKLDGSARARGVLVPALPAMPGGSPSRGSLWVLRARPATGEAWWQEERDPAFDPSISVAAFLMRFPAATRIAVRRAQATDDKLADFWMLLEMAAAAGEKIRPDDAAVVEGVGYLVSQDLLSEPDAARVMAL